MEGERKQPSKGFWWSIPMFFLILAECLVLVEIVFADLRRQGWDPWNSFTGLYFLIVTISCVFQLGGILLVLAGWFRLGGVLQIVASSVHVVKGEGIIGVIGGIIAYRYSSHVGEGQRLSRRDTATAD